MLTTARWQSKPSGAFVLQQRDQNIRITERKNTEKNCFSLEVTAQKYQLCISWSWPAWGQKDSKLICAWIHTSLFQGRNLTLDCHRAPSPPSRCSRIPECKKTSGKSCSLYPACPSFVPIFLQALLQNCSAIQEEQN